MASSQKSDGIPFRRFRVTDQAQIPHDYSSTPGGSIFSTTPGGTRIYYDRETILLCKSSPIARSPIPNLPCKPGVTCPEDCQGTCNRPKPEMVVKSAEKPPFDNQKPSNESSCLPKGDDGHFDLEL